MQDISMRSDNKHIPVFLSSDNNFAPFIASTICSIMDHTKSFVDFFVLDGGISETNKEKIKNIKRQFPNFCIEFIEIDTQKEFKDFPTRLHFSIDMYTRYLIPLLKPHLKKVIYSDVDVIFNGDIKDLYEDDLNGYIIGAVPYTFGYLNPDKDEIKSFHKRLKLSEKHKYFESGLLLINCERWRNENITHKLIEKVKRSHKDDILTPDQDVLNIIFENNYQPLDNKYIVVPHRVKIMLANEQTRKSIENPFVYHFATSNKPWKNPNIVYADHFWKYAKKTPFYKELISNLGKTSDDGKMVQEKKPLVSIVTITRNLKKAGREKTFLQCLESVHNQIYQNIEHIIIDGASSDGTADLIKEYADKGWITYVSEPDKGIYDAMNKGVKMAKGKYIAFLNSDDFYHNNDGIGASVRALEESGADFSYAPAVMLHKSGKSLENHPQCMPDISSVFWTMPFCHQTMLTKKDVMEKEGMFDPCFESAADYDFVLRLCLKKYKSVFVEKTFTTYRLGGLSDDSQAQSIRETTESYFKNYGKLVFVAKEACGKIYNQDISAIPPALAIKLREFGPYFNYGKYLESIKLLNRLILKSKRIFSKGYAKFEFAIFSPRKFSKKYLHKLLGIPFRQSAQKD